MRLVYLAPTGAVLLVTLACGGASPPTAQPATPSTVPPVADASDEPSPVQPAVDPAPTTPDYERRTEEATWPTPAQFAEVGGALRRPWTVTTVRLGDTDALAFAQREGGAWTLARVWGTRDALPSGCSSLPCPWPRSLAPSRPLEEPPALPEHVRTAVTYARTLLDFEGPLSIRPEGPSDRESAFPDGLPAEVYADGDANLAPYLEQLRRYHPMGYCSMDTRPQQAAMLRARAAAHAGRTGWAVQGWVDTVGYWSSPRMAWSSYGQAHPQGHLELLQRVGVAPDRLLLGLLIDVPGARPVLHLADVRRIVPDLGPDFAAELRTLAASSDVDPYNRALLFAAVADLPFANDPLYRQLPPETQAFLSYWSR